MLQKIGNLKAYLKNLDIFLGVFFIAVFIVSGFVYIQQGWWYEFFWLSNHWALINGIAFLARSRFLFSYIVSLVIIPELFWIVDFVFMLNGHHLFGITNYWFDQNYPYVLKIIALQHLFNPFASIYGIARFGFHRKAWIGAFTHGIIIGLASLYFFDKTLNVNCVWKNCMTSIPMPDFVWRVFLVSAMILHVLSINYLMVLVSKTTSHRLVACH